MSWAKTGHPTRIPHALSWMLRSYGSGCFALLSEMSQETARARQRLRISAGILAFQPGVEAWETSSTSQDEPSSARLRYDCGRTRAMVGRSKSQEELRRGRAATHRSRANASFRLITRSMVLPGPP